MKLTVKLIISVAVAAVATAVTTWYLGEGQTAPFLFIAFCAATLATTLLVSMPLAGTAPAAASSSQKAPRTSRQAEPRQAEPLQAGAKPARGTRPVAAAVTSGGAGTRQHGKVKWFNVSKGFGFITRDDGEEIFVHFRSIRGGGRRGLRDGQKVSFIVADSDKGPQAEDVEALD